MAAPTDAGEEITPTAGFEDWTRLPYTFTIPPQWFDDLEQRGVDPLALRSTPLEGPSQWTVEGDRPVCSGDGAHTWLRYDEPLEDFEAHVEWKFEPVDPGYGYNSGVFVRNDVESNRFYQIETGATPATAGFPFTKHFVEGEKRPVYGDLVIEGERVPFHPRRPDLPDLIEPPGEWNTYDVRVEGSRIELRTNGVRNGVFEGIEVDVGHFGLEAEGFPISFRNVRIDRLDAQSG